MKEERDLLSIAEALADGLPVDWSGLLERDPTLAADLQRLRAVQEIAAAFRVVREPAAQEENDSESR